MLVAFLLLSTVSTTLASHIPFTLSNHRVSSLTTANTHAYFEDGRKMTITWDTAQISNSANTKLEVTLRSSTNSALRTLSGETGIYNTGSVDWTVNYGSACENCKLYFRTLNLDSPKSGYTAAFDLTMNTLAAITVSSTTGACSETTITQGSTYSIQWTTYAMANQATFDVALLKTSTSGTVSFDRYLQQRLSTTHTTFTVPDDLSTSFKYYLTVADTGNSKLYDACPSKVQWSVVPPAKTCDYSSRKADHAWVKTDKSVCETSPSGGGEGASTKCGQESSLVMECKKGYKLDTSKTNSHCSATTGYCTWECNTQGEWEGGGNIPCVTDTSSSTPGEHQDGLGHLIFYVCVGLGVLVLVVIVVALCSRCRQKTVGSGPKRSSSINSIQFAWAVPVSENVPAVATTVETAPVATSPSAPPISPSPSRAGSIELVTRPTEGKCDVEAPPDTSNPMYSSQQASNEGNSGGGGGGGGGGGDCCDSDCMFFLFFVSALLLIPVWIAWLCYWRKDERIARASRNVNLYTHALNVFYILFFFDHGCHYWVELIGTNK